MECRDMLMQRYYQLLRAYLDVAKQIDSCRGEDKAFYQDVCLSFAAKIKAMQTELADQGFILCQGSKSSFCPMEKNK